MCNPVAKKYTFISQCILLNKNSKALTYLRTNIYSRSADVLVNLLNPQGPRIITYRLYYLLTLMSMVDFLLDITYLNKNICLFQYQILKENSEIGKKFITEELDQEGQ